VRRVIVEFLGVHEQNLIERVGNAGPSVFYRAVPGAQ